MGLSSRQSDGDVILERSLSASIQPAERTTNFSFYLMMKRVMDVIGAMLGLIFLIPLFIVIAIIIKIEDPSGPIFFYQVRVGKNEKSFRMYKFRSMVSNAEELLDGLLEQNEVSGAMFKMKEDPRITSVGKFIRRTSIDELPQLWNVIRGDMSLVGPRPPLPREVDEYTSYDKMRLRATPGCTGLWQVSGRSQLSFNEMVELDLMYIEQRSVAFDIKIIFKTVKVLLGSNDAF
ncbi:sugar transferase [Paenibacillus sp. OV219]|uniref:sugar transferase n=1 Tax=Paenibacillus sp. OV219 TaxID=1884377 RepID=UPI0008D35348|nr:sugar transferase [Paenibacillus sp. OV219]SEN61175.1 Sugar transferase involved in LPS biosynthesis (colanic, teichoic acid) [Paenibacillus sp. OV219]